METSLADANLAAIKPLGAGSMPRDIVVQTHYKLVDRIARSVFARVSNALPVEDLVQIGVIALIEASDVFEDRGVAKFSTYASTRIRGAMIDDLRKRATMSRQALRNRRQFATARDRLSNLLGRKPRDCEMACELKIDLQTYQQATNAAQGMHYETLDSAYSDHDSWFADLAPNALDSLERSRLKGAVADAIKSLKTRESMILQLYYVEEMNLEEIAEILGVTAVRVCQLKKGALETVRKLLGGWH